MCLFNKKGPNKTKQSNRKLGCQENTIYKRRYLNPSKTLKKILGSINNEQGLKSTINRTADSKL